MEIEIRLRQVLKECGRDKHGITQLIADDCGLHRHTVSKLYHNQAKNPSLDVLGKICGWLVDHDVRAALPQALFGSRPARLWQAVTATGHVAVYLGESHRVAGVVPARRSISRRDAAVETNIIQHLTAVGAMGAEKTRPELRTQYVPFRFSSRESIESRKRFKEDIERAKKVFDQMKAKDPPESAILIGSQRVNYLVEYFVADLFGCRPFQRARDVTTPFYVTYRSFDRPVPSCFGGLKNPPGRGGRVLKGLYYLTEQGRWEVWEWKEAVQDAGVVITVFEPETKVMRMAAFGFSGRGTSAVGTELVKHPRQFWPETSPPADAEQGTRRRRRRRKKKQDREVRVYICRFKFVPPENQPSGRDEDPEVSEAKITPLSDRLLNKYLSTQAD